MSSSRCEVLLDDNWGRIVELCEFVPPYVIARELVSLSLDGDKN